MVAAVSMDSSPPQRFIPHTKLPGDCHFRLASERDLFRLYKAFHSHLAFARFRSQFQRELQRQSRGRSAWIVVEHGPEVVAMGQCIVRGKVAEMANLKVLAGRQNMGIGTAMIRALISFARLAGASVTEIGVSTDNKRAFNLYSRLGFNQDRTLRIREAEPAIILRKSI